MGATIRTASVSERNATIRTASVSERNDSR
jgi:hypothetical protein